MDNGDKTIVQLYKEHKGKVSDKWTRYLIEYDLLFNQFRDKPVRMLEIGVQNGGGLEIWAEYFKNGKQFIGCDINPDCANLCFEDPRIKLVIGDANTSLVQEEILSFSPELDIVNDDGSHRSSDIIKSFRRYFPSLSDGGIYVVEDLHASYWKEYEGGEMSFGRQRGTH
jgi:cephalosporin hydroxylase